MDESKKDNKVVDLKVLETDCEKAVDEAFRVEKVATNPIAKNFVRFFVSPKGKFSIKDILR